jgi:hypothetical protein
VVIGFWLPAPLLELIRRAADGVAIRIAFLGLGRSVGNVAGLTNFIRNDYAEGRPFIFLTFDRNGAVLQLYQLFHDSQSKPCTAVLSGDTGVGLTKAFKYGGKFFFGYANARVGNDKLDKAFPLFLFFNGNMDADGTHMGKLECIADQVL